MTKIGKASTDLGASDKGGVKRGHAKNRGVVSGEWGEGEKRGDREKAKQSDGKN